MELCGLQPFLPWAGILFKLIRVKHSQGLDGVGRGGDFEGKLMRTGGETNAVDSRAVQLEAMSALEKNKS